MNPYPQQLESLGPCPTMKDIVALATTLVPDRYRNTPWRHPHLQHGTAVLDSDDALACYLASYGQAHSNKMQAALANFPWQLLEDDFEVVDWGCGQGLATCCFAEELVKRGKKEQLRRVTLIEPSKAALERAVYHVKVMVEGKTKIVTCNQFLPSSDQPSAAEFPAMEAITDTCVHFFSNILDLPSLDLRAVASLTNTGSKCNIFVCTGPINAGNWRIDAFHRYFTPGLRQVFADVRNVCFGTHPNGRYYTCRALGFVTENENNGQELMVIASSYAPVPMRSGFVSKALGEGGTIGREFEVKADFDLGAMVINDPDSVLAVMANIVGRGMPTLCSPMVERAIAKATGAVKECASETEIRFEVDDQRHGDMARDVITRVGQVEAVLLRLMLAGRLDIRGPRLRVVAYEGDVPCVALAMADLAEMYSNLCSLSAHYSDRRFPDIDLTVVNRKYANSPLQLEATTVSDLNAMLRNRHFDLALEISPSQEMPPMFNGSDLWCRISDTTMEPEPRQAMTGARILYGPLLDEDGSGEASRRVDSLRYFLQLLFRKRDFRPGQLPILDRALALKSVIGLLPTGGGKSLTYQLAAMLQPGITVVVDPLKSLMEDQVHGLHAIGIDSCAYINSQLTTEERQKREAEMEQGQLQLVFLSPERLAIGSFRKRLRNMRNHGVYFAYGVVDEVHCVSEWGQDFRFPYLHVGRNLYNFVLPREEGGHITLFGLTATASFDVLADVERELTGYGRFPIDPQAIVRHENCNRLELQYRVIPVPIDFESDLKKGLHLDPGLPYPVKVGRPLNCESNKGEMVKKVVQAVPQMLAELQDKQSLNDICSRFVARESLEGASDDGESLRVEMDSDYLAPGRNNYPAAGIVFCPHVGLKGHSGISVMGNAANLSTISEVGKFHGSNDDSTMPDTSLADMEKFRDNRLPLMVATKAFGMGIDKPNVRFTVHANYSNSLEAFVQEAGRAGRDRRMALSLLLVADYHLKRIRKSCKVTEHPVWEIRGKWFRAEDLDQIIDHYGLRGKILAEDIEECTPSSDLVRVTCPNYSSDGKPLWFRCNECPEELCRDCEVRHLPKEMQFEYFPLDQLEKWASEYRMYIPKERLQYQCPDFRTMMYFFDNSFKGARYEWAQMDRIVHSAEVEWWLRDAQGLMQKQGRATGIANIIHGLGSDESAIIRLTYDQEGYNAVAKAVYRLCVLGIIDDFTQDYSTQGGAFSIQCRRKPQGSYYTSLLDYLCRYYTHEQAVREVEHCSVMPKGKHGWPEVHRCLVFITQFVYQKIARKRRRAIEDMREFCISAIRDKAPWLEVNERLKDELFFYFNSKYARHGFATDSGEPFSLLDDSQEGKREEFEIVEKYLRVVDPDVTGVSGSANDSLKHLQGAVRLIMRGGDGANAALNLLGAYAIAGLGMTNHPDIRARLKDYFLTGYNRYRSLLGNTDALYHNMQRYYDGIHGQSRHVASADDFAFLQDLQLQAEFTHHLHWLEDFSKKYTL
ncbi:MAG: DEAD/DEAH box helicase [Bacteroidales bacterium]|nr:DEAD/DEAH box helicase [Bacteroidales bacterium]